MFEGWVAPFPFFFFLSQIHNDYKLAIYIFTSKWCAEEHWWRAFDFSINSKVLRASQADLNKADLYLLRPQERQPMIRVVCFALLKQTKQKKKSSYKWQGSTDRREWAWFVCSERGPKVSVCLNKRAREEKKSLRGKSLPGGGPLLQYCCQSGGTTLKQTVGQGEKRWVDAISPCHPFPPLCCIERNPSSRFSSESWRPGRPKKWPSWKSWRWRTSGSERRKRVHRDYIYITGK